MRVMGWVQWDEDGMSTCVLGWSGWSGCCQVLRSIHRAGKVCTYLPQVCICKSGSQQIDTFREVYRAWMKTHHVACTVYMQQSTPCKGVRTQGIPNTNSAYIYLVTSHVLQL